jgi:hypothetical protein
VSILKKITKKQIVLKYLTQGFTQSWISKYKRISKVIVSRYTKEFLYKGWLKCIDEKAYCKIYRATPITPSMQQEAKVNLLRSDRQTRIHNLCWKYKLLEQPRRKITWDKEIKLNNNIIQKIIYFPLYTISVFEPTNNVFIWVKEEYTDNIGKWEQMAQEHMMQAQKFLQKMFLCRLSLPEIARDPHFAKPIDDPAIMNVLKRQGILKFGEVWIDASKPGFEYGEIESTDVAKLETMQKLQWSDLNIPDRMKNMEAIIDKMTINVGKMAETQLEMQENIKRIMRPKQMSMDSYLINTDKDPMFS